MIEAPVIENAPSNVTTVVAKTVRFNCSLHDPLSSKTALSPPQTRPVYFPLPRVRWLKDGAPLKMDNRVTLQETQLILINSVEGDTGIYQCIVTNEAGYA